MRMDGLALDPHLTSKGATRRRGLAAGPRAPGQPPGRSRPLRTCPSGWALQSVSQAVAMDASQGVSRRVSRLKCCLFRHTCRDSLPVHFSQHKGSFCGVRHAGSIRPVSLNEYFRLPSLAERTPLAGSPPEPLPVLRLPRMWALGGFLWRR